MNWFMPVLTGLLETCWPVGPKIGQGHETR